MARPVQLASLFLLMSGLLFPTLASARPNYVDLSTNQTPLRNQGAQGSCIVFASTAALEAAYNRAGYGQIDLSEALLNHFGKMMWIHPKWAETAAKGADGRESQVGAYSGGGGVPTREPYDFVLIVCEGQKSEPNYFNKLRDAHRLSSLNVRAAPAEGSDPMSVVRYAERSLPTGYDHVYCVFDRNGHTNYEEALRRISEHDKISAVTSIPCFEIWVLLHFRYSAAPFQRTGQESACDKVLKEVKRHIAGYSKGHQHLYGEIEANLDRAMVHSKRLSAHNDATDSCNPATQVHVLVEYLKNLKPIG